MNFRKKHITDQKIVSMCSMKYEHNIQHKQFYVVIIDGWVRQGECYETELRRHLFQFVVLHVPYRINP